MFIMCRDGKMEKEDAEKKAVFHDAWPETQFHYGWES